jgi:hypothetical protein
VLVVALVLVVVLALVLVLALAEVSESTNPWKAKTHSSTLGIASGRL